MSTTPPTTRQQAINRLLSEAERLKEIALALAYMEHRDAASGPTTEPDVLIWHPNPGHCPVIPDGYEFVGVRILNGRLGVGDGVWSLKIPSDGLYITHYAIRKKE